MHKTALLSVAAALTIGLPALAQMDNPSLKKGIELYNNGRPKEALPWLSQAVRTGAAKYAIVHFYIAKAYLKINQTEQAKEEFELAVGLEPNSKVGMLAKKALDKMESTTAGAGAGTASNADKAMMDMVNKLPAPDMPPLPKSGDVHPTLYEIDHWTPQLRAQYLNQAQDRVPRAEKQLYNAQQLLSRAQSAAAGFVPTQRTKKEDEATFKRRVRACQKRATALVQPYQDYVDKSQQELKDSKTILNNCQLAYRNVNGYMSVNRDR